MLRNPLLLTALILTAVIATWGVVDTEGLAAFAQTHVAQQFGSRAWFIMLVASLIVATVLWLAISRYGDVRLGGDDDRTEFSTVSWLTMLFAAGMGVGLLFYGATEPLTHFALIQGAVDPGVAARYALTVTNFDWAIHAWSIYAITALVIAYFAYRKGRPGLIGTPIRYTFRRGRWVKPMAWIADLLAIYAIAIGLAGSLAIGIFQVQGGIQRLLGLEEGGTLLQYGTFVVLCVAFLLPLRVDLSKGMARLSNLAMILAVLLMVYVLLVGPTHFLMNGIVDVATKAPESTTFFVLDALPLPVLTGAATVAAAFLFLVTSVVSAAFVLSMFSTGGNENPPVKIKLIWGLILAALGLAMMLTNDVATVRAIIALGAMAFVFILPLLVVALLKTLAKEEQI